MHELLRWQAVQFILPGHSPDRPVPGCIPERERGAGMSSEDYCRGFDNGHKMGFEAGFQAALNTFSMKLHDLSHEISFFEPEAIEARYQDWFGKDKPPVLQVFEEPPQEAEA